jgi:hypothetical protein
MRALMSGESVFREGWVKRGCGLWQSGNEIFVVSVNGSVKPWEFKTEDLLANDWLLVPEEGPAS